MRTRTATKLTGLLTAIIEDQRLKYLSDAQMHHDGESHFLLGLAAERN